ncbi:netrin-4 isoform X2 [Melanerpes formicivorus]|uniref:netrin-4 isoform X2 n=1 Tax=Melanerpes formicivorus TaxID=211600 RepID=UPI00358EB8BB
MWPPLLRLPPLPVLPLLLLLLLGTAAAAAAGVGSTAGAGLGSPCERACNPRMGNLAHGRVLQTETACGRDAPEAFCAYAEDAQRRCGRLLCGRCSGAQASLAHPAAAMADSPFRLPRTWWQSARDTPRETIQLDLEAAFYFTHLILVFKSPRPAAMVLERSQDFGQTWKPYKYFAANCSATFGLEDDVWQRGALCTSRYSSPFPCTGGEVIYRALSPPHTVEDPYSAEAQAQLKITNLRVRLLEPQGCPCLPTSPALRPLQPPVPLHYAIYDFMVKGSCFCNGHADHCVPVAGFKPLKAAGVFHVVHGKCMCKHNTAGPHCQHCAPLYNDQPWQAADGKTGAPRECRSCKCNGHADTCHFDLDVWLASGNRSGGICDNCQHNTEGQHCQRCKPGFYRDLRKPFSAPDACKPCSCHPLGSAALPLGPRTFCDPSTGDCPCKPGVAGPRCDHCLPGYWGFGDHGCRPCHCPRGCHPHTGDCSSSDMTWHNAAPPFQAVVNESEPAWGWEDEQGFSALRHSVIKAKILSAHDKGSHAEVNVKIKKVLKSTKLKILRGKRTLYPESWTNRGCTCPILNPGLEYLVAGHEDVRTGRLLVNMKSFVHQWKSDLGRKVLEILKRDCN